MMDRDEEEKSGCNSHPMVLGFNSTPKYAAIPLCLLLLCLLSPAESQSPDSTIKGRPHEGIWPLWMPVIMVVAGLFLAAVVAFCGRSGAGGGARRGGTAAARGLDPSVIATFPTLAYSTVKGLRIGRGALECSVCLSEFQDDEELRFIPRCEHVFHPDCIDAWLESRVTCPLCRANLVPKPGESTHLPPELHPPPSRPAVGGNQLNNDIFVPISDDDPPPHMEDANRRSPIVKVNRSAITLANFRSNSTGHSMVETARDWERYTLRLPEEVRELLVKKGQLPLF